MDEKIYPLTFTPVLQHYIWGGRRLETVYGRTLPPGETAESWEISGHPHGPTAADAGYWKGRTLPEIQEALGEELLGRRAAWALRDHKFPLLVKLLDAQQDLSIQVHPGDRYAMEHEDGELGKTEMWYVLHADPGSEIILGTEPGATREDFRRALADGTVESVVHRVPVAAGQAVPVPAGTVHALLAGVMAAEIMQNSDATYRVYDWGRVGADGKPRPLHIEKALDVINFGEGTPGVVMPQVLSDLGGARQAQLVRNRYFVVEEVTFDAGGSFDGFCDGQTLEIWGCVAGEAKVGWEGEPVPLPAIRFALLPAALGDYRVTAQGPSTCLRVYLPK